MKKASKILAIILVLILLLPFVFACGGDNGSETASTVENGGGNEDPVDALAEIPSEELVETTEKPTFPKTLPIPDGVEPQSLYTNTVPSARGNWGRYNLGIEFEITVNGVVSQLKAYILSKHSGEMNLTLYNDWEDELVKFTFEAGDKGEGWAVFDLDEPLFLRAGTYAVALTSGYDASGGNLFAWASGTSLPSGGENLEFVQGLYADESAMEFYPSNGWGEGNAAGVDLVFYPIHE